MRMARRANITHYGQGEGKKQEGIGIFVEKAAAQSERPPRFCEIGSALPTPGGWDHP